MTWLCVSWGIITLKQCLYLRDWPADEFPLHKNTLAPLSTHPKCHDKGIFESLSHPHRYHIIQIDDLQHQSAHLSSIDQPNHHVTQFQDTESDPHHSFIIWTDPHNTKLHPHHSYIVISLLVLGHRLRLTPQYHLNLPESEVWWYKTAFMPTYYHSIPHI